jgi:hypothetical protein
MMNSLIIYGKKVEIEIFRKDIKRVRLKVFPTGEVRLSVPSDTPDNWIICFLDSKSQWIEDKIQLFEKTKSIEKEEHICSGNSTRILGRQLSIRVLKSNNKKVQQIDKRLLLYTPNLEDQDDIDNQFNNWWQKSAKQYFIQALDSLYPIIRKHGIEKPQVVVKKMKTLWGSCSRKLFKINLNYYLYKAPSPCIEYVILHELAHLIYSKHTKDFYDFITIYMPDWQERKRLLDFEIVLGI